MCLIQSRIVYKLFCRLNVDKNSFSKPKKSMKSFSSLFQVLSEEDDDTPVATLKAGKIFGEVSTFCRSFTVSTRTKPFNQLIIKAALFSCHICHNCKDYFPVRLPFVYTYRLVTINTFRCVYILHDTCTCNVPKLNNMSLNSRIKY